MRLLAGTMLMVAALAATIAIPPFPSAGAAEPRRVVVEIRGFKFEPRTATVGPGDVLVWKNSDIVPHTATASDKRWDSPAIEPNGEWETAVTEDMAGRYYCRFHPSMTATLDIRTVKSGQ